ncbi:nucleoside hydrolase [Hoyosella rhizosphaerae]|uniref:Nucleoside hydrolase IunH n=1 Tax=Hoyosella rhizosphaerae TaxID=1755582 RepID=A0A916XB02_9ACTN|nr:nucleoside hydrolase [Hoyosella rhizosphaerae]MBN4926537.1 nucleoside hydrolase [Hoyosella rhizosphaerae]GGC58495.1 putative nucleoside hydrolase IunH [Hoyosella rhizosphaerae]
MRQHLMLDLDTGIDDSLALVYLLASPEASIRGIAATGGNVSTAQVAANTLAWLDVCHAGEIPVAMGAQNPLVGELATSEETHGPHGVGYAELPATSRALSDVSAAVLWVELARKHDGHLVGLVTGPMTNLALALEIEPNLPRMLKQLVIMGGAFNHPGNTTPTTEWNVAVDPEAAKRVFDAFGNADNLPIVCGLDLTERIIMRPEHATRLAEAAGVAGERICADDPLGERSLASNLVIRHLLNAIRFYMEFHRAYDQGFLAHMHDPFAAAVALNPQWAKTRLATLDVELVGTLTRGTTVADWMGMWGREPNVNIAVDTDPDAFMDHLITRVGEFARNLAPQS